MRDSMMVLGPSKPKSDDDYRPLEYRPAAAQYHGPLPTQTIYERDGVPRLSLNVTYNGNPDYEQPTGTAFLTPSPSDYISLSHQGQLSYRTNNQPNYTFTPPGASPNENDLTQYQNELEESMFGNDTRDAAAQSITAGSSSDGYWLPAQAQSPDRKVSYASQDSHGSATLAHGDHRTGAPQYPNEGQWQPASNPAQQTGALPISHNYGFLPNHVLAAPGSSQWQTEPLHFPSSFYSGNPGNSFQSGGSHVTGTSPSSCGYSSGPLNLPHTGSFFQDHLTPTCDGTAAWRRQGGPLRNHSPFPSIDQCFHPFQSLPPHPSFMTSSREYNDPPSMAAASWQQQQHLPSMSYPAAHDSMNKNEILIECRQKGMSYRDIKRRYGFPETESTLRGRYRTLSKEKRDRVRKPEWTDLDNFLLRDAVVQKLGERKVRELRFEHDLNRVQISWKAVGEYIKEQGGSYLFGAATVKKQYAKLYCSAQSAAAARQYSFSLHLNHSSA